MRTSLLVSLLPIVWGCQPTYDIAPVRNVLAAEQRWQHHCIAARETPNLLAAMNQLGSRGWELAAAAGTGGDTVWCFKRPMGQ